MRRAIAIAALITAGSHPVAFSGEKKCPGFAEAIPICKVLADSSKYDRKDIRVTGTYYRVIHGAILEGSECEETKVNVRLASDWQGTKTVIGVLNSRARRNEATDIIVRGTFRVASDGCFGQACTLYEIEVHELLCAEMPKSANYPH